MIKNMECEDRSWTIAIFAARETLDELMQTLDCVLTTITRTAKIDLLINGNEPLALSIAEHLRSRSLDHGMSIVRVWSIALGDKAHAWNQYVHSIWPGGPATFFMDGYVRPDRSAFALLERSMLDSPNALAATGAPRTGRSSQKLREEMARQGGLHGNLHCISLVAMKQIREIGFKLPLGLYRTDSTIGAALIFGLDPARNDWVPSRIQVQFDATWTTEKRHWWRLSDLKAQAKRMLRQAQGTLENRAVREHFAIRRDSVANLPETAADLVLGWVKHCPNEAHSLVRRNLLFGYALRNISQPRNWQAANTSPKLIHIQKAC